MASILLIGLILIILSGKQLLILLIAFIAYALWENR